ncbi:MAG: LamG-like jellyroll fold domain-containing protein, partial [Candidatus Thermoplasmatota archaeon]|nr:LamG-like jellyroll fold domain-containing protein [Candidatus Thermoplasmatota archaeon]
VALNSDRYIMWAIMTTTTDWTWTTTDARVPIGAWSFIALTYDGSTVKTYVDGQIKDTDSYANGNVADSSEIMCIGAGYNAGVGGFGEYFLGSIDEVRISDIARSPLEIQAIYNTPSDLTQIDTVKLNGGSGVWAYSVPIPINAVTIMDSYSFFKKFLTFTVLVLDNVTGLPVDSAELQIFNNDDETIFLESTNQFGLVQKATILQYTMEGATIVDNNPMNISISKDGYVPWWTEEKQVKNLDFEMIIEISENRAPEFPPILNVTPVTTHLKRPAVSWNGAKDWNSDIVTYEINVYMDELYGTEIFDQPLITRATQFQFEKNLRFNREYWVEIMASDPWGMSDTVTFSFRTVNNQPTTPEVIFLEDSVSSNDDIVISIANHTTDIDIDPIDDLSYMVEWYKVGEDADILLMSGINLTTLPSEETNEGDEIKVYIKPYDGIEYGIKAILYIEVVNFVPENIIPYVDVEIDEDTTGFDMVDLNELFTDRDNDNLFFSVDVERHISVEIDPVSGNVSFIPDENWNGVDYIIIQARDTKYHDEEWPTVTINVTVNSVNDAPEFILVNDEPVSIGEMILIQDIQGAPLTITSTAIDADEVYGDKFDFSTNFLEVVEEGIIGEDDLQFLDSTGSMSIYLSNDLVGEHIFNLTVTDEGGASSDVTIRLIVDNKNDPPTPPAFKDLVANQKLTQGKDEKTVFSITPSDDPDIYIPNSKENLIYNWEFGDGEVLENGGLEVSHKYATSGNYTVTVTVLDKAGESETIDITIRVDVYQSIIVRPVIEDDTVDKQIVFIIILVLVVIIALIAILVFIFRKDPLSDVAEAEEQAHEVLVAKQQEDALAAHEQLQALMGSMGYAEAAGPALPSAPMEGQMEALPAPSEPIPEQGYEQPPMEQQPYPEQPAPAYEQPPMEQQPYYPEQPAPAYEQPPMQAAPQQPPMEPIPAPEQPLMQAAPQQPPMEPIPAPEQPPMQPAPAGTVPTPEQPQAQTNLPAPEEQQ